MERPFRCTVNPGSLKNAFRVQHVRGETKALMTSPGGYARVAVDGPEEVRVLPYSAVPSGYEAHTMSANARWVVLRKVDNVNRKLDFMLFDADTWQAY